MSSELSYKLISAPIKLSSHDADYVRRLGYEIVFDGTRQRENPHGAAAFERLMSERRMLEESVLDFGPQARVLDVGSNAVRIRRSAQVLGLDVQLDHLIPHLIPNDRSRQTAANRANIPYHPVTLQGFTPAATYDALNFTHSLYYVEPTDLIASMVRIGVRVAYSTQHNFTQAAARICNGTVRYHYDTHNRILSQAQGDEQVYRHSAMQWLFAGPIEFNTDVGVKRLSWTIIDRFGDTFLYKFEILDGPTGIVPEVLRDLEIRSTADNDIAPIGTSLALVTTVNKELKSPTLDMAFVPISEAYFFYGLLGITFTNGDFLPLPRGLIGVLAGKAVGQPRTPMLYQVLVAHAKNFLTSLDYPAELLPKAAIVASVTALCLFVELETVALGTVLRYFTRLFNLHSRVLDFEPAYIFGIRHLAMFGALCTSTIVPMHYYGLDAQILYGCKLTALTALAHPFVAVPATVVLAGYVYHRIQSHFAYKTQQAEQWRSLRSQLMSAPVSGSLSFDTPPRFAAASVPKTAEARLKPGSVIRVHDESVLHDGRAMARLGLSLHGIGIATITPSYVAKTTDNAILALKTRVMKQPLHVDQTDVWVRMMCKLTRRTESVLNHFDTGPLRDYDEHSTFGSWVARFPEAQRDKLKLARQTLVEKAICDDDARLSGIVKQEKTGTITLGDAPIADPRLVLSLTPRASAFLGPFIWAYSNVMKKRFDLTEDRYLSWAVGKSNEELGLWLSRNIDSFSSVDDPAIVITWDVSRFEAHQRQNAQYAWTAVLGRAGCSNEYLMFNNKLHKARGSIQGRPVSFSMTEPIQVSGGPGTSVRNFMVNASVMVESVGEPGPSSYAALINGDDGMMVTSRSAFERPDAPVNLARLHAGYNAAGFTIDGKICHKLSEIEFCSNIPYPIADGQIVFGPKIGRTLMRFAWTLSSARPDVYGAAKSLEDTVNHIPFLRQFIAKHIELGNPSDARYFKWKYLADEAHESSPETYAFIQERYGLTHSMEQHFEKLLSTVVRLPAVIDFELVHRLVEIDE